MNLKEFLQLSEGKWFAQRTSYSLSEEQPDNSKSELTIALIKHDHGEVIKICQEHNFQPSSEIIALKVSWDNSVDWGKTKDIGSSLMVFIPDANDPQVGQILKSTVQGLLVGKYVIANDQSLTLTLNYSEVITQERQWFVSPNLRMRTNLAKSGEEIIGTAFYSEIRRIIAKTEQSASNTTTTV